MKTIIKVTMEWDFGQDEVVFANLGSARKWLNQNNNLTEYLKETEDNLDNLESYGLLSFHTVEVI